jgi:fructose-specific phosphotransferase system IIC component
MSEPKSFRETMAQNTFVHVAFGFLAMGAWAVFANRNHPLPDALLAGLVQGTVSGMLTLFLKKGLEWMSARFKGLSALVLPPLITAATILTILFTAHTLAGTPEILATIAVPFTVSTTYAILYNLRLWRVERESPRP